MSSKTILVATADDNEPEDSLVEEQDDEQEELDTRDYGEYTQEPIQLRRSKPKAADVAPNTDRQPPKTSKLPKRPQARKTDKLAHPRLTLRQRVGNWIRRNLKHMGIGMLTTLTLWVLATTYVVPLWVSVSLHWIYGADVPITQYDANVGHHGTSHFLAEYWRGEVVVIEFPGGDATKARTYAFPLNTTHDTTHRVITLHVQTINLHGQLGKPDVVLEVQGYIVSPILYNTGDTFTTTQP